MNFSVGTSASQQHQPNQQPMVDFLQSPSNKSMPTPLRDRLTSYFASSYIQPTSSPDALVKAQLVEALMTLLSKVDRLTTARTIGPAVSTPPATAEDLSDPLGSLGRRVLTVQSRRSVSRLSGASTPVRPHLARVFHVDQDEQLWASIDDDLETVLRLCRQRTPMNLTPPIFETAESGRADETDASQDRDGSIPSTTYFDAHLPPEYDAADYEDEAHQLPEYDDTDLDLECKNLDMKKSRSSDNADQQRRQGRYPASPTLQTSSEKMRMDLESIASAIDRLYLVAPQLHNQRVELKQQKVAEMESARRCGQLSSSSATATEMALEAEGSKLVGRGRIVNQTAEPSKRWTINTLPKGVKNGVVDVKGKGKAREVLEAPELTRKKSEDLDRIVDLIGKSSGENRRIADQRVDVGDFKLRMEKVKQREQQKVKT